VFDSSNMRFHETLDDVLGNSTRVRVLRVLTRSPDQGFTGRELARKCGTSPSQTIDALRSLEETGVVRREVAGPSHVWRLSSGHVLSDRLTELFVQERALLDTLKLEVKAAVSKLDVERAWLFGSVARRDERPTSDVDLLVQLNSLAEKGSVEEALGQLSTKFALLFGNPLSSVILTRAEVQQRQSRSLISTIQREGIPVAP
jgi:uncharacterized protein